MKFTKVLYSVISLLLISPFNGFSEIKRVLFIGNSYTGTNDLPNTVKNMAQVTGDTLYVESVDPGGYTFQQHYNSTATKNKIQAGNWDFVVLQAQSQEPSFPDGQVENSVYPYARGLDSLVKVYNPCARTVFYMTWGRKNGDASNCPFFPPLCTYLGMDSLLQLRYMNMTQQNEAWVAPVAKVWRQIIENEPNIDLYVPDESHPSVAGTFAAASTFYTIITQKDPTLNSYIGNNSASVATVIKQYAKQVAFDSLTSWTQFNPMPSATFNTTVNGNVVNLTANVLNQNYTSLSWNFGDGQTSNLVAPMHTYTQNGNYEITLTISYNCDQIIVKDTISINTVSIKNKENKNIIKMYPNPVSDKIFFTEKLENGTEFVIYDNTGSNVLSGVIKNQELNIQRLPAQSYKLVLKDLKGNNKYATFTVVK